MGKKKTHKKVLHNRKEKKCYIREDSFLGFYFNVDINTIENIKHNISLY